MAAVTVRGACPRGMADSSTRTLYPFLEGQPWESKRSATSVIETPLVSDGILFILQDLLYLDGERISYRALDGTNRFGLRSHDGFSPSKPPTASPLASASSLEALRDRLGDWRSA